MIMRITWGKVRPGMWPEYAEAYRQTMEPISSGIQGLRGRWLAHDLDEADAGFAVSIWDSQADLDAYRSSELFEQQVQAPLSDYFVDEFRTYHCEVDVVEDVG